MGDGGVHIRVATVEFLSDTGSSCHVEPYGDDLWLPHLFAAAFDHHLINLGDRGIARETISLARPEWERLAAAERGDVPAGLEDDAYMFRPLLTPGLAAIHLLPAATPTCVMWIDMQLAVKFSTKQNKGRLGAIVTYSDYWSAYQAALVGLEALWAWTKVAYAETIPALSVNLLRQRDYYDDRGVPRLFGTGKAPYYGMAAGVHSRLPTD